MRALMEWAESNIEKSANTIFCLLNNSHALISPCPPADTTKDPFVDSGGSKCSDAVLCMTSIKRFHSPEAQNNPARKKIAPPLQPHFVRNTNYKGKCGALLKQPCCSSQICSVIILGDDSHVLL